MLFYDYCATVHYPGGYFLHSVRISHLNLMENCDLIQHGHAKRCRLIDVKREIETVLLTLFIVATKFGGFSNLC